MSQTDSGHDSAELPRPPETPPRTISRILLEAFLVALIGALVWGVAWEVGAEEVGWIIAIVIWVAGTSLLEVIRLVQSRK